MSLKKHSLTTIIGWVVYVLLTSLIIYYMFPSPVAGGGRLVVIFGLFLLLGAGDYFTSKIMRQGK